MKSITEVYRLLKVMLDNRYLSKYVKYKRKLKNKALANTYKEFELLWLIKIGETYTLSNRRNIHTFKEIFRAQGQPSGDYSMIKP